MCKFFLSMSDPLTGQTCFFGLFAALGLSYDFGNPRPSIASGV